jgi:hypothetical protein
MAQPIDPQAAAQVDKIRSSTLDTESKIAKILALQAGLREQEKNAAADREKTLKQVTADIDRILKSTSGINNGATSLSQYGTSAGNVGTSSQAAAQGTMSFSGALSAALEKTSFAAQQVGVYREQLENLAGPHVELAAQLKNLSGGSLALYRAMGETSNGISDYYTALGKTSAIDESNAKQLDLLERVNSTNVAFTASSELIPEVMRKMTGIGVTSGDTAEFLSKFNAQGMSLKEVMGGAENVLEGYANVLNDVQLSQAFATDQAAKYGDQQAEQLAKVDFALKAYNITNADVTEMIRRNYVITGKATTGFFDEVVKSAEVASLAYGLSSEEIVNDTIAMMNNVQMFGFRTPDEFARISKAARDAHASVSELAGVMGKFDTFETAASAVGDLNATLGTNFDALELMTLKYTDPVKMLQRLGEGFRETGMSFDDMFMAPEKLPFLTSTLNTLGITAEQLRAMFEGSASATDIIKQQSDAAKDVTDSNIDIDELMKSRITIMKSVATDTQSMVRRLDEAAQLLAGSSRDIVQSSQVANTTLLKLSNDITAAFAKDQADLVKKAADAYKDLIEGVGQELGKVVQGANTIIAKMQTDVAALIAQMKAAGGTAGLIAPPAAPAAPAPAGQPATSPQSGQDVVLGPGGTTRISKLFGGLFEEYILDSRDAVVAGPPKMLDDILIQAKMMKEFIASAREANITTPSEAPATSVARTSPPAAAPQLPTQLQARLQPIGSTLNISIDSASFIQYIMETMAKEYPV